ncbi:MAG: ABC transporter permease [Vicinamibacteria bacterium]
MTRLRELWYRLRSMARCGDLESGLDEEIRFHLDQQAEKNLRAGLTPDEARRQALVRFGGVEQARESTRDQFRAAFVQDSLQDLRHGARALRRAPAFTLVAVLTLACGIGATTAVFTVVQGVLIKPLPYADAGDLVSLKHTSVDTASSPPVGMSASLLVTYARESRSFREIGVWSRGTANLTGGVLPEEVASVSVSAGTLPALGASPMAGRLFSAADHAPGSEETVILSHACWQRRFGGDPSVVGREVTIDATPRTVVAVMPAGFRFLDDTPDVLLPLRFGPGALTLGGFNYEGIARLAPGVTLAAAQADLARLVPVWLDEWPPFPGFERAAFVEARLTPLVRPLREELVGGVGDVLWVLLGTIGIVLVIACANVANLALVRAEGRHHELATRTALGASRFRVARAMLLESLLLGVAGGALGVPLAWAGLRLLAAFGPAALPRLHEIQIDATVLAFTAAVSVVSALFFGGVPVLRYAGRGVASALRAGGRGSDGRERQRMRNGLVVAQVALALVLLVASGLMVRTFVALRAVPSGFSDPHRVQLVRVTIPEAHVADPERVLRLQRDMRDRLAEIPGVSDVSFTGYVPMAAGERSRSSIEGEGARRGDAGRPAELRWFRYVAPGLFRTLGTPLVAGRDFTWDDLEDYRPVAVLSENLAREMWGEPAAALGRRVREGSAGPWREVVGVVGDVHDDGLRQDAPRIAYWPSIMQSFLGQPMNVRRSVTFVIRSDRAATEALLGDVRAAIGSADPSVALTRVRTLGDVYDRSMAGTWFTLVMLAIAAAMALGLGVVGIYGVIAYAVAQRRREIGIRVALGASPRDVTRVFVRHGVLLGLCGAACGAAGAALLTRLLGSLLFGTSPLDPATYVLVALGLVGVTALASYVPAHAATRVDPARTLRGD